MFTKTLNKVDHELNTVVKNYEFNKKGELKKNKEVDTYMMCFFDSCKWDYGSNDVIMTYSLVQDEFRV